MHLKISDAKANHRALLAELDDTKRNSKILLSETKQLAAKSYRDQSKENARASKQNVRFKTEIFSDTVWSNLGDTQRSCFGDSQISNCRETQKSARRRKRKVSRSKSRRASRCSSKSPSKGRRTEKGRSKSPLKKPNTMPNDYVKENEKTYTPNSNMNLRDIIDKIVTLERDEAEFKQKISRTRDPSERSKIELGLKANSMALADANRTKEKIIRESISS